MRTITVPMPLGWPSSAPVAPPAPTAAAAAASDVEAACDVAAVPVSATSSAMVVINVRLSTAPGADLAWPAVSPPSSMSGWLWREWSIVCRRFRNGIRSRQPSRKDDELARLWLRALCWSVDNWWLWWWGWWCWGPAEARRLADMSFSHTFSSPGSGGPQRTNYNQKNWEFAIMVVGQLATVRRFLYNCLMSLFVYTVLIHLVFVLLFVACD